MVSILPQPASEPLYLQGQNFASALPVFHGFFTRKGGVSEGVYASLNCGAGSDDAPENVASNKAIVARAAGIDPSNLYTLYQIHSDQCLVVDRSRGNDDRPQADALLTDKAGIALGILTADCTPVLFAGTRSNGDPVIGAAHAGWKGALGGVLENTLKSMKDLGAADIQAIIGPTISKASYEVTNDFAENFMKQDEENERFFLPARNDGHLMFDLPGFCARRLALAGVKHVEIIDRDTYSDEQNFYSYRRKTHRNEADYARQISVIAING